MRKLVIALAVVLLGIAPILASDGASLHSVSRPFVPTTATSPGIIITTITIGQPDFIGKFQLLPCFNCVPFASVVTLGLSAPLSLVPAGADLTVAVTADDVGYTGTAAFSYAIRATPTATPVQTGTVSGAVTPGLVWLASFQITTPITPGRYILQGSVVQADGTTTVANSPLFIE